MTDRELLERAAWAVGYEISHYKESRDLKRHFVMVANGDGISHRFWNPLQNDGDALRLAVALGLTVEIHRNRVMIQTDVLDEDGEEVEIDEKYRDRYDDPWIEAEAQLATRRAIVRAAAAMADT